LAVLTGSSSAVAAATAPANGLGTKAALSSAACDSSRNDNGAVKLPYGGAVPCVKPFAAGAKNGGATSQGVTGTTIKVVVRKATDDDIALTNGPPKDRATGQTATMNQAIHDSAAIFEHTNQQWGRKVEFSYYQSTGADEASQRADAVAVAAMKPFAVLDIGGKAVPAGDVFETLMAQDKIMSFSSATGTNKESIQQTPYRWTATTDYTATALLGAELIGKQLIGKKAEFAGTDALKTKTRTFGIIRSLASNAPDQTYITKALAQNKVKIVPGTELTYDPGSDPAQAVQVADQNAGPMVSKLKDAGVTSVLLETTEYTTVAAITRAMKSQEYSPELITMGVGLIDIALLDRSGFNVDQDIFSHAFGVLTLYPPVQGVSVGPSDSAFKWFWGENKGVYSQTAYSNIDMLFAGIHMAGPNLTPATFKTGFFQRGAVGGAKSDQRANTIRAYGRSGGLPYDEYLTGGDAALAYWDPNKVGPSVSVTAPDAKGNWMFLNGAKRYLSGDIPKTSAFFTDPTAINVIPVASPADSYPAYPCDGCPVNGGTVA